MDRFTIMVKNTANVDKQTCLRELGELVNSLQSFSINGKILSDRNMTKTYLSQTESLTPLLKSDGSIDDNITNDVNVRIECLHDFWKLKDTRIYNRRENQDSDDDEMVPVSEIADISAEYFVSFGIQLVAAACAGHIPWMKALLMLGGNPNEVIVSDKRDKALTAFRGCTEYAPHETRTKCLDLLMANRCKEGEGDIIEKWKGWENLRDRFENGFGDVLQWAGVQDTCYVFDTDLQRAARHCDHERMKVREDVREDDALIPNSTNHC